MPNLNEMKNNSVKIDLTGNSNHNSNDSNRIIMTDEPEKRVDVDIPGKKEHEFHAMESANLNDEAVQRVLGTASGEDGIPDIIKEHMNKKQEEIMEEISMREELANMEQEGLSSDEDDEDDSEVLYAAESRFNPEERVSEDKIPVIDEDVEDKDLEEDDSDAVYDAPSTRVTVTQNEEDIKRAKIKEIPNVSVQTKSINIIDNDTFDDEELEDVEDEDNDELLKKLQKQATERLKPASSNMNLASFTVAKKPTTRIRALDRTNTVREAKWVLPNKKSCVFMREMTGANIELLRQYTEGSNSISMRNKRYKLIYDHISSAKPNTFEAWMKTTSFFDIDHYFFALYVASFAGTNYLPITCDDNKCGENFLTEDIPIMELVDFENKEAKEEFNAIYESEEVNGSDLYVSEIIPLNNYFAIGFKEPSIYDSVEPIGIEESFREKHSAVFDYIPYIDCMYEIDLENKQFIPIAYKIFPNNSIKTYKSKILKYEKILQTLSPDEFGVIQPYIREIMKVNNKITYKYPAIECQKCGKEIASKPASGEELVFTRNQLAALVNTPLK